MTFSFGFLPTPPYRPTHGPQTWLWWRLVSFSFLAPNWGYRLWIYSRWGALNLDYYRK